MLTPGDAASKVAGRDISAGYFQFKRYNICKLPIAFFRKIECVVPLDIEGQLFNGRLVCQIHSLLKK